jgi:hypothetical protein
MHDCSENRSGSAFSLQVTTHTRRLIAPYTAKRFHWNRQIKIKTTCWNAKLKLPQSNPWCRERLVFWSWSCSANKFLCIRLQSYRHILKAKLRDIPKTLDFKTLPCLKASNRVHVNGVLRARILFIYGETASKKSFTASHHLNCRHVV